MRRITILVLTLALTCSLAACKEKEKKKTESKEKERQPIAELFVSDKPDVFPPAKGIEWGMTMEEAKAANEALAKAEFEEIDLDHYGYRMQLSFTQTFPLDDSPTRIQGMQLSMYTEGLDTDVVKAWGESESVTIKEIDLEGELGSYKDVEVRAWYNEEKGLRAFASPDYLFKDMVTLELRPYLTVDKAVGSGAGTELAVTSGWLGLSIDELRARAPTMHVLEPTEGQDSDGAYSEANFEMLEVLGNTNDNLSGEIRMRAGKIVGYSIRLGADTEAEGEAIMSALAKRLGAPTPDDFDKRKMMYPQPTETASRFVPDMKRVSVYVGDVSSIF